MEQFQVYTDDCFDRLPTIESGSVDLVIADPPYGTTQIEWDDNHPPLPPLWNLLYGVGKPDCVFVFYSAQPFTTDLIQSNRSDWRYEIIWRKTMGTRFLDANRRPLQGHENLEVFIRKGHVNDSTYNPQKWESGVAYKEHYGNSHANQYGTYTHDQIRKSDGERHPCTVVTFRNGNNQNRPHSSAKPLALMRWLVRTYTDEGDLVLAPFCGSGRAGVAAVMENRRFIGIEKDPSDAEGARKRCRSAASSPQLFHDPHTNA